MNSLCDGYNVKLKLEHVNICKIDIYMTSLQPNISKNETLNCIYNIIHIFRY